MYSSSDIKQTLLISAIALIFDFLILVENVHVVIIYDSFDVLRAALTHFNVISVEYLVNTLADYYILSDI